MNENDRLSQIETAWSIVRRAHGDQTSAARSAQELLLHQYGSAIQRYLRGALRDEIAADDAYQDFAVRFLRGDFHRASQQKGRFRSFLKTTLFRMVADHYRGKKRRNAVTLEGDAFQGDSRGETEREQAFTQVWRDEMMKRAWAALAESEKQTGKPWFTVMRLRLDHPHMQSKELAATMSRAVGKTISSANLRVLLHRARELFSTLLIDAIANSLDTHCNDEIEEELAELELLGFCQAALEKRKLAKPS